jgi:BirA family transcriptional regulator, biotin operon repressor / biotin---[acetyl-CoA-carboxylase] ligase
LAVPGAWDSISKLVASEIADVELEITPLLDSTNSELMRRARAGRTDPILLVALAQTAGRGRMGRQWLSNSEAPGGALTFSLGLPLQTADWSGLSLAVGVSVAQSLHPDVQLKWPNDVWWRGRKLAGILIETAVLDAGRYAVIGVGMNIAERASEGLTTAPAWLEELAPELDAAQAFQRVAAPLVRAVRRFEREGFAPFRNSFMAIDALRQREVSLSDGIQGVAQGVNERGALLVHTSAGMRQVDSAEVSVRPLLN